MTDDLAGDLRALGDSAAVRPLDFTALRTSLARRKRRRNVAGGLAVLLVAALAVPAVQETRGRTGQDRLASGPEAEPTYLMIVSQDEALWETGRLPDQAESCLGDGVTREGSGLGVDVEVNGSAEDQQALIDCLEAADGVLVFRKSGPEHMPVKGRRADAGQGASLTQEQASRPGVDASAECMTPGVRESAPPFEGEQPLDAPTLIAAYLTDQRGYAAWDFEYNGGVSVSREPVPEGLVRLCWYQEGSEYQLVISTLNPGGVPNGNLRSQKPVPILAPPAPRSLTPDEVQRRSVLFPQPEGVIVRP